MASTSPSSKLFTPTATFTLAGLVFAGLAVGGSSWAYVPAIVLLAIPGVGGIAISLYEHVEMAAEEWTWQGLVRAFARKPPDRRFWGGIATHLPQALLSLFLLLRKRCQR